MAVLPTQSFATIVSNTIAGIQGRASKLINFSTGSTLRAIVEGFAGLSLWLQALILQLLTVTRLTTSVGIDVDTFTADFMPSLPGTTSPRLGAQASSGQVTFSRLTAAPSSCFIAVGTTVKSSDGTQSFAVIGDATYATFSATLQGYTLSANVGSIVVPVIDTVAGAAGNVQAGAISVITSPVTGIDNVTNQAAFTNGFDQESDGGLKARFAAYILGLSRGDIYGLTAAILGVDPEVQWTLTEGYNLDGSYHPGFFFVVADDGSGNPTQGFLDSINAAAQAVRPLSVQCAVFAPSILFANPTLQITTATGFDHNTVVAQVAALVATNINSLGLGVTLHWSQIAAWAYSIPGVIGVQNVLINGVYGDAASIVPSRLTVDGTYSIGYATVKAGNVTVS
jgi:hypothetical protein